MPATHFVTTQLPPARRLSARLSRAERIFGLLPDAQATEFRQLWQEFDARVSAEATFANALDRLMPLLQNAHNGGGSWLEFGVTSEQAFDRKRHIGEGSAALWNYAKELLTKAQQLNLFSRANVDA